MQPYLWPSGPHFQGEGPGRSLGLCLNHPVSLSWATTLWSLPTPITLTSPCYIVLVVLPPKIFACFLSLHSKIHTNTHTHTHTHVHIYIHILHELHPQPKIATKPLRPWINSSWISELWRMLITKKKKRKKKFITLHYSFIFPLPPPKGLLWWFSG